MRASICCRSRRSFLPNTLPLVPHPSYVVGIQALQIMREASDSEPSSQSIDAEGLAFIIPHVYGQLNQTVTFTDSYKQHIKTPQRTGASCRQVNRPCAACGMELSACAGQRASSDVHPASAPLSLNVNRVVTVKRGCRDDVSALPRGPRSTRAQTGSRRVGWQ